MTICWVALAVAASGAASGAQAQAQAQTQAQTAAASPPAAAAVDPAAVQALRDMGAYLQTLQRFAVHSAVTGERVLADGQKLQHSASATLDVERPNRLRALMRTAASERQLVFDGRSVTLYSPIQQYYSTVEYSGNIGSLIDRLEAHYGVQVPLSDLFRWGTPEAPLDRLESAMNAGQAFVGDELCDHYAFRQGKIDWQIWIAVGRRPLPRKIVVTSRADEARPQSVTLLDWNLMPRFSESVFHFVPPAGATKVEWVARKTK
ncbi:MAG TPA: DUF2092 domain-containing protein [Rubrivivax sp.]|nr:DUF2092 domain-containing protein [Rubrivivax sp.]